MAIIPYPERGQPIDVSYIATIVTAVNDLSTAVSPSVSRLASVDTPSGRQNLNVSETKVIAGSKQIASNVSVDGSKEVSFQYDYPDFKYPPIVTATLVNVNNSEAGKDISVVLTNISTSRAEGVVKFNTTGVVTATINLIIVGVVKS